MTDLLIHALFGAVCAVAAILAVRSAWKGSGRARAVATAAIGEGIALLAVALYAVFVLDPFATAGGIARLIVLASGVAGAAAPFLIFALRTDPRRGGPKMRL